VILVVSHAGDEHAGPVLAALRRLGARGRLLDLAAYPARGGAVLRCGEGAEGWSLEDAAGRVRAAEIDAVWWRRPREFRPAPGLSPAQAAFSYRQTVEAMGGFWASLRARWVNDPWAQLSAAHKPRQLEAGRRAGLVVPPTLVTNVPREARAFLRAHRDAVCKSLHATPGDWHPTRRLEADDLERIDEVRFAPVILQRYVPGVDVRVTAVGGRLFAAAVDARATRSPEDFRPVFDESKVEPCRLPAPVVRRLRALLRELGLAYAAVDLRRTEAGEHVFLEANPAGQWLFVEWRTGQPITAAVAALLAGRRGRIARA